jgi:hypothetical protein
MTVCRFLSQRFAVECKENHHPLTSDSSHLPTKNDNVVCVNKKRVISLQGAVRSDLWHATCHPSNRGTNLEFEAHVTGIRN